MSATPSAGTVHWYSSQKFKAYVGSWFTLVIGWAMQGILSNSWDWKAVAVSTLLIAGLAVKDWMGPDIVAPFAMMNKSNTVVIPPLPAGWKPPESPNP